MVNVVAEATVATTTVLPTACSTLVVSATQCTSFAPMLPYDRSSPTAKPWAVRLVQIVGVAALQMTPRASGRVLESVNVTV